MEENAKMTDEELDSVTGGSEERAAEYLKKECRLSDEAIEDILELYDSRKRIKIIKMIGIRKYKKFIAAFHSYL